MIVESCKAQKAVSIKALEHRDRSEWTNKLGQSGLRPSRTMAVYCFRKKTGNLQHLAVISAFVVGLYYAGITIT